MNQQEVDQLNKKVTDQMFSELARCFFLYPGHNFTRGMNYIVKVKSNGIEKSTLVKMRLEIEVSSLEVTHFQVTHLELNPAKDKG